MCALVMGNHARVKRQEERAQCLFRILCLACAPAVTGVVKVLPTEIYLVPGRGKKNARSEIRTRVLHDVTCEGVTC